MIWQQLIIWVVSFLLSDYFRERLPAQTASGLGDFNIPTATEGRVVPIIPGGSMRIEAPNCVWYGDFAAIERTVETGVVFKKDEVIGFTYELAFQYALCKTPLAGITGVWIGDDQVFDYIADAAGIPQTVVDIDRDDLFGGVDNGGGFIGRLRLFPGTETQGVSAFLNTRIDPLPAYRGTAYIMVTDLTESVGANIGEANQLRYLRVSVQAFDTTANGGLGDTLNLLNDEHFIGEDANPIAVAYDLYVNQRWGRGFPPSDIDKPSFDAAHATCFTEGIGFSQVIDEQTTTGEIQDTIEQHVDGYIGPNPVTGRIEVTLARQDYILANEFQASAVNIQEIKKWSKGDWSQTFNRVRVRYTDRAKQWNETHAVELAPGNLIIQGGRTKTKELRFQGVHTADVASKVAARTRRQNAQPIASGTIELDRTAYQLRPGSIISLTSEKINETNLATRVTKAGVGSVERNTMEFEVVSDVFDEETAIVTVPPPTDFVPPIQVVIAFGVLDQAAFECPFILARFNPNPNPAPRITTLARRNLGNSPTEYEVIRRTRNPPAAFAGGYTSTDFVSGGFCQVGTLRNNEIGWTTGNGGFSIQVDPIGAASLDALIDTYSPTTGGGGTGNAAGICVISPGLPGEEFIVAQTIVDDLGGIRLEDVWRGCMDTPMKPHTAGEQVWFIWTGGMGMGDEVYNVGDGVDMKFLPRSPTDALLEPAATSLPEVLLDENAGVRTSKPLLPYTITVNSTVLPQSTDEIDFDTVHTSPAFTGAAGLPALRDWRNQSILGSIQGLDLSQTGFNPDDVVADNHQLAWWLHDLDADPTADRLLAVAESAGYVVQATAGDRFDMAKSALIAGGVTGLSFNAKLEVEMRADPVAQTQLQVSHDTFDLFFIATGIFSLEPEQVSLGHQFNGDDTDVDGLDELARPTLFIGNAEIDTASSTHGGGSVIFDGVGDFVHIASAPGFDWYDIEWTLDMRVRFDDIVSAQVLIGQEWLSGRRQWYLEWDGANFQLRFSRNGADGPFTNIALGAFAPNAAQWYALRVVQKKDPSSPRFSCYIDGTRTGTTFTSQSHSDAGVDFVLGGRYDGGGVYALPFTGQIDEVALRNFAAIDPNDTSYTVEDRPEPGPAGKFDALVSNMEDVDTATAHRTDDTNRWDLTFGATSEIDTAQFQFGTSSLRCDGVNNLTPALADGVWLPETLNPPEALPQWNLRKSDFVMEAWVRFVALPNTNADGMAIIAKYNRPSGNNIDWYFYFDTNDDLVWGYSPTGNISSQNNLTSSDLGVLNTGQWYHAAAQRRGQDLELYFDGNRVAQAVDHFAGDAVLNQTNVPVSIGRFYDVSSVTRIRALNGFIDAVRVRIGTTFYNGSTYTVPAAPPEPGDQGDRNLLLLHHFDGADFFATDRAQETDDGRRSTRITFEGGARYLDANPKFGVTHGEMDDGDAFNFTQSLFWWDLADSDFTIDIWYYADDNEAGQNNGGVAFFNHWAESGDQRSWRLAFNNATDELEFVWTTLGTAADERRAFVSSVAFDTLFPTDTWVHVAVERQGSTLSIFVDGVLQTLDGASASIGADVIFNSTATIRVGQQDVTGFNGDSDSFWDEFRITKSAEYGGSSFTPEVAAYPNPTPPNV